MCYGLRECSTKCINPAQECVTQRQVPDNIFRRETAAVAQRACRTEDSGVLFTYFACAYPSVNHQFVLDAVIRAGLLLVVQAFLQRMYDNITTVEYSSGSRGCSHMPGCGAKSVHDGRERNTCAHPSVDRRLILTVLSRAMLHLTLQGYLRCIYKDNVSTVGRFGGPRGRLAMARGVLHGCHQRNPLHDGLRSHHPSAHRGCYATESWSACACTDDFAVAAHSLRLLKPIMAERLPNHPHVNRHNVMLLEPV